MTHRRHVLEDAAADQSHHQRASKRLSVRRRKEKIKHRSCPGTEFSADENAPLVERSSTESHRTSGVQSGEGAGASTSATTAPTQVAGGPALLAKAKRREKLPTSRDDFRAKPLPDDQASAMGTDSPATLPSWRDAQSPEGRNEPSWLATSSAMSSNPARLEAAVAHVALKRRSALLLAVDPRSSEARAVAHEAQRPPNPVGSHLIRANGAFGVSTGPRSVRPLRCCGMICSPCWKLKPDDPGHATRHEIRFIPPLPTELGLVPVNADQCAGCALVYMWSY